MVEKTRQKERLARTFDVVVVMGAKMVQSPQGLWYYPSFKQFRTGVNVDGDIRARAIQQIYARKLAPFVIVTGGRESNGQSRAEALVNLAMSTYSVPKEHFMKAVTSAPHSLGNIAAAEKFLKENPDKIPHGSVAFLTQAYHVRRTGAFVHDNDYFKADGIQLGFLSAEGLLLSSDKTDPDDIKDYYLSPHMKTSMRQENQGVKDFKDGRYKIAV